jgi:hypothetical protein
MNFILNLDKVLQTKSLPSWVHKAAFELKTGMYLTAGEFFEKLDDEEVYQMKEFAKEICTEDFVKFELETDEAIDNLQAFSVLCFILALGEGEVDVEEILKKEYKAREYAA